MKHVHDTFKVSPFSFHNNQCNILLLNSPSKFYTPYSTVLATDSEHYVYEITVFLNRQTVKQHILQKFYRSLEKRRFKNKNSTPDKIEKPQS